MDERAFDALYVAAAADVRRFVARRLGTRADVDDVVADCFLVAWRRAEQVPDDPEDARRWLFEVAHNVVRNVQRSRRRRAALDDRVKAAAAGFAARSTSSTRAGVMRRPRLTSSRRVKT